MGYPGSPVAGIIGVHKTMCGDHIYPWSRSVYWYGLIGIPLEIIPIVRSKRELIDCRMLRIKAKLSLRIRLEVPEHVEYLFEISPARQS